MKTKAGDILFLDTNILLSATDEGRTSHEQCRTVFRSTLESGVHLALSGQVIREYLVVATRNTDHNGFGLSTAEALSNINEFVRRTVLLEETEGATDQLRSLVGELEISGKRVHDANIVATMMVHSVRALLTENARDFRVFDAIEPIGPSEFLG